jgi:hypothetical protein
MSRFALGVALAIGATSLAAAQETLRVGDQKGNAQAVDLISAPG